MPRKSRIDAPGAPHLPVLRGIERRSLQTELSRSPIDRFLYFGGRAGPQQERIEALGALDHIIMRCMIATGREVEQNQRSRFGPGEDRENFLERPRNLLPETKTSCYAWARLPNHAHFLVRTGEVTGRERGYQLYPPPAGYPVGHSLS